MGPATGKTQYRGDKSEGCQWFKEKQKMIKDAPTVLVVGGGALGIRVFDFLPDMYQRMLTRFLEFATDIKSVYPEKSVTLLHSRQRLLPRFDERCTTRVSLICLLIYHSSDESISQFAAHARSSKSSSSSASASISTPSSMGMAKSMPPARRSSAQ